MIRLKTHTKKLLGICILFAGLVMYGQDPATGEKAETGTEELPKESWTTEGVFTFLFNQTAFDNWLAGGENSIGGNVSINYEFNYSKGNWIWDNRILTSYGLTKAENTDLRKTDDRFELNSQVGKKASEYWNYSFFLNLRTQLINGFDYENDPDKNFISSGFFKPGYLTFGPGMIWKKNDDLKFNIAPATSKITFLEGQVFTYDSDSDTFISSNERITFGVEPEAHLRYELGFYASGYYKFNIMENVSVENILNLYANYLEKPQNVDINYQLNIIMKINKYLTTNLAFQTIYDDDAFPGFQIREVFGLGVTYSF